jgi:hypothetical protein
MKVAPLIGTTGPDRVACMALAIRSKTKHKNELLGLRRVWELVILSYDVVIQLDSCTTSLLVSLQMQRLQVLEDRLWSSRRRLKERTHHTAERPRLEQPL